MANILITGANRGLGRALFQAAQAMGHTPIGTTRDGRGGTWRLNLDEPTTIAHQLVGLGPVDILVNNAGVITPARQSPLDMDFAGFAHTMTVNAMAPLAVVQAVLPRLRQSAAPKILSVSSQMAWMGYRKADRIAYRASKAALNKVMQGLATALELENIPVALVDPGWVRTDMGGPDAEDDPDTVAQGLLAIADRLTIKDTGKFFRFTGEERAF
ncbi:SDR family NAD(P)-dependent oxidoreductase [Thalassobacter stenotrophicus]|uniref:C signal n=2 Tax=Thalassobacter stenotrophicus TaxID=266809 RepID=A0A0P1F0I8_9RHOB|nr:SDR family NAD(P)-dependent oxidoreductase [Thalassobacter stenotrophicus]CUH60941.1 C signal [Thalassobacter stenotrophicus]SHI52992.1 NAD(P)-dependent dehydrogenase, short-chain alcohol dehydrogenase family [Thalassobacter stenotrophicus DSM 16310]